LNRVGAKIKKKDKLNKMANTVKVIACDNELIIVAFQFTQSYEILNLKSGNGQPVNVDLNILAGPYDGGARIDAVTKPANETTNVYLPAGTYDLSVIGLNWGGVSQFTVDINTNNLVLPLGNQPKGLVFHPQVVSMTV
jgi:hypothetical protein